MAQFNQYDSIIDLSAIKNYCRENGCLCFYAKEQPFVQEAEIGKFLGVVESGYFKYTVITTSGNEAVVGFAFEGEIVSDFYNSYNRRPSEITIKAGSDSSVAQIPMSEARELLDSAFEGNISPLIGPLFSEIYDRYLQLYRMTPTESYVDLTDRYPHIFDIVSLRDIASYLLITPTYLSRIRKNLAVNKGE
ncbi:MAG: Crp/Fnr family transcriptional regulator [Muribaculaceae bacterium]|nr:Crp/Fnr family transcriptional regulator [Muribaculaceae bacterium]